VTVGVTRGLFVGVAVASGIPVDGLDVVVVAFPSYTGTHMVRLDDGVGDGAVPAVPCGGSGYSGKQMVPIGCSLTSSPS
jgi:hypothetical protein